MPVMKKNQPSTNATALGSEATQLIRPLHDFLDDGTYKARITKAAIVTIGDKPKLRIDAIVEDEDGNEQDESFVLTPNFRHPSSAFYRLLEATGRMPDRGEAFDAGVLVGFEVLLTLQNVEKNGNVYTNIVDVEAVPDEEGDPGYDDEDDEVSEE